MVLKYPVLHQKVMYKNTVNRDIRQLAILIKQQFEASLFLLHILCVPHFSITRQRFTLQP